MTSWQASNGDHPTGAGGAFRALGLAAVCLGVAALAAATFVLSYQGLRAIALQAGIEPRYARGYPLLIDAMLVIALASVLALRGAGLPSRTLSWLTLLVVLGAAAGADTLHATGRTVPHNAAVFTAAVLPWVLLFVAFVLLLALLRHARERHQVSIALAQPAWTELAADDLALSQQSRTASAPPLPVRTPQSWQSASIVPGLTSQLVSSAAAGAAAGAAVADGDGPAVAEADPAALTAEPVVQAAEPVVQADEPEPQTDEPEPQTDEAQAQADEDEDMPVFHRIWSSPTPPEETS
jgi:Protein of unknown function (DUF2637)